MSTQKNALNNRQVLRAAFIVLLGFLASGLLGLVRSAVFNATLGADSASDAFYAAQRIPETIFVLVAGGALGSSFIPVFNRFFAANDEEGAWRLASSVMTCAALIATLISILFIITAPTIVPTLLVPEDSPASQALTVELTQWLMITVVIFSISGLLMGILNARQLFLYPSIALSMNNIGQIFGALVLTRLFPPEKAVYGLVLGAILGSALHLIVQLPGLRGIGAKLRFLPDPRVKGTREVLFLMGPRVLGLAVVQLNFIVNVNLTSGMIHGSRSVFINAWNLMFFALGMIAQSMGTAVFPTLSALAAQGDMQGFKERLNVAMRNVLFLALPSTVGLIVLGQVLIGLLFERGAWTSEDTAGTAWAIMFLAIGIAGHSLLELLARAFYALSDTKTPVFIGVIAMAMNILLSIVFIRFIGDPNSLARGAFAGLGLANALTTLAEAGVLWILLRRRIGDLGDRMIVVESAKTLIASVGMGIVILLILPVLQTSSLWVQALVAGGIAAIVFFALAFILGVSSVRTVPQMILRRFRRSG